MKYLTTGSVDPHYNLAFEEYFLTHTTRGDYLILWQNDNTIVIGQNQNASEEINASFVDQHGITVVRRSTGGGAVYHDLGNLNYSFITDLGNAEELTISRFTEPVVEALQNLGIQAEASGRNDILVNGKKVSGTAQRIAGGRVLHHGTLLFDSDPDMISGALQVDSSKFISKSTKSVRGRVGNIRHALQKIHRDMSLEEFWRYLLSFFYAEAFGDLPPETEAGIMDIKHSKYDTWEWNYGKTPKYDFRNKQRFSGGTMELRYSARHGIIEAVTFRGDFLSKRSLADLEQAFHGVPVKTESILDFLSGFPLAEYFGDISAEEILSLFEI